MITDRLPETGSGLAAGAVAPPEEALGPERVLGLVVEIAETLHARALRHEGRALWLGDQVEPYGSAYRVVHRACDGSLYDGTAGIGWFLAQYAATTGDPVAREDALAAFRHALDAAPAAAPTLHDGAAGIGWAVLDGGLALDHPIAAEGLELLGQTLDRAVGAELPDELIAGRSGVILAALAGATLARGRVGSGVDVDRLIEDAGQLGLQSLTSARRDPTGWTWPNALGGEHEPPLCGLGHGASGPILAFAHLAGLTGDDVFATAAREGARAERAWLRRDDGWPDLREYDRSALDRGDRPAYPIMWCHGAVGIGLSRIRAARLLDEPALFADAATAMALAAREVGRIWRAPPGSHEANFSLCHGAAGLIELFGAAARELGEPSWRAAASGVVQAGLAHRAAGVPWVCGVQGGTESSGLLLGLAGTGAALMRLAVPGQVTSPLTIVPERGGASLAT